MNYILKNKYLKVSINSLGAELNSLQKIGESLEYIWQGDEKYWKRSSPILFPIVGKLKDNKYIYKDKIYTMNQHGFARDMEFSITNQTEESISFTLTSNEQSYKIYPFSFELTISYLLQNNSLKIEYKVTNTDLKDMYFSIGAHPAFNWPLANVDKNSYYFLFDGISQVKRFLLEDGLIANEELLNFQDNKLFINEEIFKKDALIFNDNKIKQITLKSTKDKNFINVSFDDFTHLGLWSKPNGAPFVCIEPWCGVADSVDSNQQLLDKTGIISLQSKKEVSKIFIISI